MGRERRRCAKESQASCTASCSVTKGRWSRGSARTSKKLAPVGSSSASSSVSGSACGGRRAQRVAFTVATRVPAHECLTEPRRGSEACLLLPRATVPALRRRMQESHRRREQPSSSEVAILAVCVCPGAGVKQECRGKLNADLNLEPFAKQGYLDTYN